MTAEDPTPDLPRYVVTAGGTPTPDQLAALVVAMTPVPAPAPVRDDAARPGAAWSAWGHAALLEGVGHRTFVAMPDLAGGRFPLG